MSATKQIALSLVAPSGLTLPARGAGSGDAVPLDVPDGTTTFRVALRHVSGGEFRPGDPRRKDIRSVTLAPFAIGETEVTFAEYRRVLGDAAMTRVVELARKKGWDQGALKDLFDQLVKGGVPDQPAYFVPLQDAVLFCETINQRLRQQRDKRGGLDLLEETVVRLPTSAEWQLACRADPKSADYPHLPGPADAAGRPAEFPRLGALDAKLKVSCASLWAGRDDLKPDEEAGLLKQWEGLTVAEFQDRLMDLDGRALDAEKREKLNEVLKELLLKAYGWPKPATVTAQVELRGVRDLKRSTPNRWGVWGMLDNVCEWTLWAEDGVDPQDTWKRLTGPDAAAARGERRFFLAGGSFRDGYGARYGLAQRAVWGGPSLAAGRVELADGGEEVTAGFSPGFRVVVVRRLADDWLRVRSTWLKEDGFTADAKEQLARVRARIEELAPGQQKPLAILAHYEGQLELQKDRKDDKATKAADELRKSGAIEESDKEFLDLLRKRAKGE